MGLSKEKENKLSAPRSQGVLMHCQSSSSCQL